jgi:hypothetical protein
MADKPETDRAIPAHAALVFALRHIAIQQPEARAEAQKHIDSVDEQFRQLQPEARKGRTARRGSAGDAGAEGSQGLGEPAPRGEPGEL